MEHKKFCYDKKTEPAVIIQSGDVVVFETEDANCGLIAKDEDVWPRFQDIYEAAGGCNPVTGPVYIEGAGEGGRLSGSGHFKRYPRDLRAEKVIPPFRVE